MLTRTCGAAAARTCRSSPGIASPSATSRVHHLHRHDLARGSGLDEVGHGEKPVVGEHLGHAYIASSRAVRTSTCCTGTKATVSLRSTLDISRYFWTLRKCGTEYLIKPLSRCALGRHSGVPAPGGRPAAPENADLWGCPLTLAFHNSGTVVLSKHFSEIHPRPARPEIPTQTHYLP